MTTPKPARKPAPRKTGAATPSAKVPRTRTTTPGSAATRTTTSRTRRTASAQTTVSTPAVDATLDVTVDRSRARKPLYAYVGVADLAVEKLRTLPETYSSSLTTALSTAQAQLRAARSTTRSSVDTAVETVRTLPQTLPIVVKGQLETLPGKALAVVPHVDVTGTYAELAQRGEKLLASVRSSANTQAALDQAKTARSQVKGAATSVRRAAGAAEKAAGTIVGKLG